MHNGDYPGQAFFGVYRGRRQCVEATYNKLLENIQDFPGASYEAFMNRAHALHFSRTGQIPEGATPLKPGASRLTVSPGSRASATSPAVRLSATAPVSRTTSAPVLNKPPAPLEMKAKANSMSSAVEKKPLGSVALGKAGESSKSGASGSKSSGSGAKPSGVKLAAAIRATPTPAGNKSTSNNTVRNASTSTPNGSREVEVWTDGSCLGNGKQGAAAAYAVYFGQGDPRNEANRVPGNQTNNVGEIYAVIRALEIVDESVKHLTVYTDSQYTINSLQWLPGWKRRGGMNANNKPAANYSMIKYMDALFQRRGERLKLVHVRGHQDNAGNNAADLMARNAANSPNIPPNRDWELECVRLQKKPLAAVTGSPRITAVDSVVNPVQIKKEDDDGSDYGYSDLELDDDTIDDIDTPPSRDPSDHSVNTRETSAFTDEKPIAGKKRGREEPAEEDNDVERKATTKKAKEQGVKCPNCRHKFNVTLRK